MVSSKANIHPSAVIEPTAVIYDNVTIGANTYIGHYCIIGAPPEKKGATENKGVWIGHSVSIHGLCTIDGGSENQTWIGDSCYLMKQVHVGHDAVLKYNVTVAPHATIGGHCFIGINVGIGMNANIHQHVSIPTNCFIGQGTVLPRGWKGEPFMKYVGVGRCIGKNIKK